MTGQEWLDEVQRRIAISEGTENRVYRDSRGILTIGVGFNCERSDAREALTKCGVSNVDGVLSGEVALTTGQVNALFAYSFAPIVEEARASLAPGVFDELSDARRFVICDLVYNMGDGGWEEFHNTRLAITTAEQAKVAGSADAHALFINAANDLAESEWYTQVGDRARRDVAMLRVGVWCNPLGDGSDIASDG